MELIDYFQYNSVLILTYFLVSAVALIINYVTYGLANKVLFSCYRSSLLNPLTYVRFITHIVGHADFKHFASNFTYILLVGPMIEEKYGTMNLLFMMLITAVVIGLFNFIFKKRQRILGASGIVYMMIMLSSFVNIQTANKIPLTLVLLFIFYIINEIIDGLVKDDNVSHVGHILGAVCGCIYGYMSYVGIFFNF